MGLQKLETWLGGIVKPQAFCTVEVAGASGRCVGGGVGTLDERTDPRGSLNFMRVSARCAPHTHILDPDLVASRIAPNVCTPFCPGWTLLVMSPLYQVDIQQVEIPSRR